MQAGIRTTNYKNVVYPAKGVRQLGGRGGPLRGGSSSPAAPCNGSHSNLLCQLAEANLNNL